jgi:hypothetical protein
MSKIEVDAIEPQSGTTLTIGASGDSVNIASGATITDFTSTGIDDNATSTAITINSSEQVEFTAGTVSLPSISTTGDTNTGIFFPAADTIAFTEGGAEAMRITSDGTVGINKTSLQPFLVNGSRGSGMGTYPTWEATVGRNLALFETDQSEGTFVLGSPTNGYAQLGFADPAHKASGRIGYDHSADAMVFGTNGGLERMRIDSSGNIQMAKTTTNFNTAGLNYGALASLELVRSGGEPLNINRLASDGTLVAFYQAGALEGNISVSGATVSYNGFTGTHWSRFQDNSTPNILRGTVLESLDEICDWYNLHFETTTTTQDEDGNDVTKTENHVVPYVLQNGQSDGDVITYNHEGTDVQATIVKETDIKHMKSKVSATTDAKNVYGLFMAYDLDGEGYNDFYVASVGSYVVRIKSGQTIAKGDLLQSNGDGTAKVQSDDAVRSSSFAKVLSTTVIETYDDGSYLVPCSLMC